MDSTLPPTDRSSFRIAIVCALPREADAVTLLFDQFWDETDDPFGRADGDTNSCIITGRIGKHNVVLAILPGMGTNNAAAATAHLRTSYVGLRLALLVGVCGGLPRIDDMDAYLGDVVVSKSVVQYDYGRLFPGYFSVKDTIKDSLGSANKDIRSLLAVFETEFMMRRLKMDTEKHLKQLQENAKKERRKAKYQYPGSEKDQLYPPNYWHIHRNSCSTCSNGEFCESVSKLSCIEAGCKPSDLVRRERSEDIPEGSNFYPEIFMGRIGSSNTVMRSGKDRDDMASTHNLIAFEMEGAGAWDEIPCIIIKGICDYADSHKNKSWQDFAAATAASVAKAILGRYSVVDGTETNDQRKAISRTVTGSSFGDGAWINQGDVVGNITFNTP
ncbi:hypothetical protein F53441_5359 [Fusarium austroafricanum]|uniref:Nucleoside phosphorylase domain-containing protein n=1 Tax=Fusarium austroafricanum TaxID=2364996 RepID=A0A8H4NXR9_9HYPO|nr:hypothetical protein F53441_5359 [Fusarium austroafricanum]